MSTRRISNALGVGSRQQSQSIPNPAQQTEETYVVRCELVENALALTRHIPAAYTPTALSRVITDISNPNQTMTFSQWCEVAKTQLGLDPHYAGALFDNYLITSLSRETILENTKVYLAHKDRSEETAAKWLQNRTVMSPPFMLFLFLQLFHRNAYTHSSDSWLGGATGRQLSLTARSHDGDTFLTFIRRHLYDLLLSASMGKYRITSQDVQHLGLLFLEKPPPPTSQPFGTNLPFWVGGNGSVEVGVLHTYLQQHISYSAQWYPPLELPVINGKPKILWPDLGSVPSTHVALIARVQGLLVRVVPLPNYVTHVTISSCSQCTIYLLCNLPSVSIVGCSNVTVVLGAVGGVLTVEECEMVKVVATCIGCRVVNCSSTRLYLCTNTHPTIHGDIKAIQFAPYNTFYNMLEADMKIAGVNPLLNYSASFIVMSPGADISLLPPEEFTPMSIPVQAPPRSGTSPVTVCSPCLLPPPYLKAIQKSTDTFNSTLLTVQRTLTALHQDGSERAVQAAAQLRSKLENQFASWVASTGQQRAVLEMLNVPT